MRTYRILKPLLQLPPRLQSIKIVIQEWWLGNTFIKHTIYDEICCRNPGLRLVAAVIAKLKGRLDPKVPIDEDYDESDEPDSNRAFQICFRIYSADQDEEEPQYFAYHFDKDATDYLWEVPTAEEMARMEEYQPMTKEEYLRLNDKAEDLDQTIEAVENAKYKQYSGLSREQFLANLQWEYAPILDKLADMEIYERAQIQKMALDPKWEEEAEALAKQPTGFSVYDKLQPGFNEYSSDDGREMYDQRRRMRAERQSAAWTRGE